VPNSEVLENLGKLTILILVSRKFRSDVSAARRIAGKVAPALAILLGVGACNFGPRGQAVITDPDPANKIRAFKIAEEHKDMTAVRQLVKDLESDDPAVRFYAINTLQRLTNQTFGYQYFANEEQRAAAVQQWNAWLTGWQAGREDAQEQQHGSANNSK
jgi:hypothetical protein